MAREVDTGNLREKATWLGHIDAEFGKHVDSAADEIDRLRKVVEDAPHDPSCIRTKFVAVGWKPQGPCTCWKEDTQ